MYRSKVMFLGLIMSSFISSSALNPLIPKAQDLSFYLLANVFVLNLFF